MSTGNSYYDYVLGILSGAGNAMDLPGSMIRDVLAGRPAFDQMATPFGDQNRTTGRQLARDYGMAGDRDTWGNFIGGMALETAFDPLSYAGVGLLTKGAKAKPAQMMRAMGAQAADPVGIAGDGMAQAGRHVGGVQNALTHRNYMATHNPPTGTWTEDLLGQYDAVHNMPLPDTAYNSGKIRFTPSELMDSFGKVDAAGAYHNKHGLPPFARPDMERAAMKSMTDDLGEEFRDSALLYQHYPTPIRKVYQQSSPTGQGIINKGGGGQHVVRKPVKPDPLAKYDDELAERMLDDMDVGQEMNYHKNHGPDTDFGWGLQNSGETYRQWSRLPRWWGPQHDDYDLRGLFKWQQEGVNHYRNAARNGPQTTFDRVAKFNQQRLNRDLNYGEF